MEELAKNKRVLFLGYNVKYGPKANGCLINVPNEQLIETPVAENLMMSMAIGMSIKGYIPVVYFERFDFIMNAMDAIVNHLDKFRQISNGEFNPTCIIRCVIGGKAKPLYTGPTHTQDFTDKIKHFISFPVIKPDTGEQLLQTYRNAHSNIQHHSTMIVEEKDWYEDI
jgi:pyruvate dehydrogenase E1 component beta subunit